MVSTSPYNRTLLNMTMKKEKYSITNVLILNLYLYICSKLSP